MLLAIDIGNTNSVFAVFDGDETPVGLWRQETASGRSADEYAAFLLPLLTLAGLNVGDIKAVLVSSVVPAADRPVAGFAKNYLGCEARFVSAQSVPIAVNLPEADRVGADRLVNAYAAGLSYELPAVIVDFGTATTFDVIGADGAYEGGVIAPGIHLSIEALAQATAKLPRVKVEKPAAVIGKTTDGAIQSGIYWGYVGLINGLIAGIEQEHGTLKTIIATGGLAPLFEQDIDGMNAVDQTLTLRGLYALSRLAAQK